MTTIMYVSAILAVVIILTIRITGYQSSIRKEGWRREG